MIRDVQIAPATCAARELREVLAEARSVEERLMGAHLYTRAAQLQGALARVAQVAIDLDADAQARRGEEVAK